MEQQNSSTALLNFAEYQLKDRLKSNGINYEQDSRGRFRIWWRRGKICPPPQPLRNILPFRAKETIEN